MFATFGNIEFRNQLGFSSYQSAKQTLLIEQQLINSKAVVQPVGEKNEEITISMFFHADFCDPEVQLAKINTIRTSNSPQPLTLGTGEYLGDFYILELRNQPEYMTKEGYILSTTVNVVLKEYYDPDKETSENKAAINNAIGNALNAKSIATASRPIGVGAATALELQTVGVQAIAVNNSVSLADQFASAYEFASENIKKGTSLIASAMDNVTNAINDYQQIADRAENLQESIEVAQEAVQALQAAMPITSIDQVKTLNTNMQNSLVNVSRNGLGVTEAVATRRI